MTSAEVVKNVEFEFCCSKILHMCKKKI